MTPLPHPVGWFEIYGADLLEARPFCEGVFQGPQEPLSPPGADYEMLAFALDG